MEAAGEDIGNKIVIVGKSLIQKNVISGAKDEGYNSKYNNKRIDSKWNQLS
jgi:hypothetical protein